MLGGGAGHRRVRTPGGPRHRPESAAPWSPRREPCTQKPPRLQVQPPQAGPAPGAVPMGPARGTTLRPSSPPSCFKGEDMLKIDFAVGNGIIKLAVSVFITVIVK